MAKSEGTNSYIFPQQITSDVLSFPTGDAIGGLSVVNQSNAQLSFFLQGAPNSIAATPDFFFGPFQAGTIAIPRVGSLGIRFDGTNLIGTAYLHYGSETPGATTMGAIGASNVPGFIYASQIIPSTAPQALFGGSIDYTFPAGVNARALTISGAATFANAIHTFGGIAPPTYNTRSDGTRIVLYDGESTTNVDMAIGISSATLWNSVRSATDQFQWYAGTAIVATLAGTGVLTVGNVAASYVSAISFIVPGYNGAGMFAQFPNSGTGAGNKATRLGADYNLTAANVVANVFYVLDVSASTAVLAIDNAGNMGVRGALTAGNISAIGFAAAGPSTSVNIRPGDVSASRSATVGVFYAGGVANSGTLDFNGTNANGWTCYRDGVGLADLWYGAAHPASARSMKKHIGPLAYDATALVSALKVQSFRFQGDDDDAPLRVGAIADELPPVLTDPKQQSFNPENLAWLTVAALQELRAEFNAYVTAHP